MTAADRADVLRKLGALGFPADKAATLADHFLDAEATGRSGHGLSRVDWLATLPDLDPAAEPRIAVAEGTFERWEGGGTLGYLVLAAIVDALTGDGRYGAVLLVAPPEADPVPGLRARAAGARLPGDR